MAFAGKIAHIHINKAKSVTFTESLTFITNSKTAKMVLGRYYYMGRYYRVLNSRLALKDYR